MPGIIVAVVAAVVGAAAASAAALIPGVIGAFAASALGAALITAVVGSVVSLGLSYAFGLNRPKKTGGGQSPLSSNATDTKVLVRSSVEPRRVIYGQARVSGPILYAFSSGTDNEDLNLIIALAGHPVEAIDTIWINEDPITNADMGGPDGVDVVTGKYAGKVVIAKKRGDHLAADSGITALSPDGWSSDHKLLGVAHIYVRLKFDRNLFQGVPNISALVTGKNDIFDPRDESTGFTDNWALCVLDYLLSDQGMNCAADEVDVASFIAAANLADENVPLNESGSVTQARYTLNGTFTLDRAPIDIMEEMLDAGGGALVYVQGQYRLHGGAYSAPTASLGISDFAGPVSVSTRQPRRELFNAVRGTFVDPSRFWQASEFAAVTDAAYEAEDGERIWRDVEMPFITDNTRAQRIARQLLRRSRQALTIEAPLRYASLTHTVWDTVAVTVPYLGITNKPFRIVAYRYASATGEVSVTLREDQSSSYAWLYDAGAAAPDVPDTTLISPLTLPGITITSVTATTAQQGDGTYVGALEVIWGAVSHPFLTGYEVQWKPDADSEWSSIQVGVGVTRALLSPVVIGQDYDVRVRAVGNLARGPWSSTSSGTGAADTTAPGEPTSASATGTIKAISIAWTPPADLDLAAVEVWENTSSSSAGRYYVGEGRAGFYRAPLSTGVTRWFWLRSRDRSNNYSAFVGPVSATTSPLLTDDISGAIATTASFAAGLMPVKIIADTSATTTTGGEAVSNGDIAVSVADNKLYRREAGVWIAVVRAPDLVGQITATQVTDGAITTPKLAANAVDADKLAANSVTAGKIATNAVTAGTISAGAVNTAELAAGAIVASKLASAEIITQTLQVANLIIGTQKLSDWAVNDVAGNTWQAGVGGEAFADWTTITSASINALEPGVLIAAAAVSTNGASNGTVWFRMMKAGVNLGEIRIIASGDNHAPILHHGFYGVALHSVLIQAKTADGGLADRAVITMNFQKK